MAKPTWQMTSGERFSVKIDMQRALLLAEIMDVQADSEEVGYVFDCLRQVRRQLASRRDIEEKANKWFEEYMNEGSYNE